MRLLIFWFFNKISVPVQTISPDQKPSVSAPDFGEKTDTKPSDTNDPLGKSSQKE